MQRYPRFHYAFPVPDLERARAFYAGVLCCKEGRSSARWIDFDFFGHQLVTHLAESVRLEKHKNPVDGHSVPVPHFGVITEWKDWFDLRDRLKNAGVPFVLEPHVRFQGKKGEQATMFVVDPFGNALEFKSFRDESMIFETEVNAFEAYA
jgi:extradiol dioxygenase family protein